MSSFEEGYCAGLEEGRLQVMTDFQLTSPEPPLSADERADADTQHTPPGCVRALLRLAPPPPGTISVLEPCAGRGHMVTPLLDAGYQVIAYEKRRESFEELRCRAAVPHLWATECDSLAEVWPAMPVVMNPPFSNVATWLRKALGCGGGYVAMLYHSNICDSEERAALLEAHPPSDILALYPRPFPFLKACSWWVWGGPGNGFRVARWR